MIDAVAVSAGTCVITKHLALSRSEKGPDWHVCLEPEEMREAVALARAAKKVVTLKRRYWRRARILTGL